jgi:MFS family permease
MMSRVNPSENSIRVARRQFYIATGLYSLFFATGSWLFFWRRFLTNGQIGLVDALCFLVGMLAEVPTGAIADKIGRRRTMMLGVVLMGIGYAMTGFAVQGSMILVGYALFSVGASFYSGADDAYMYDYLKSNDQESIWESVARYKQIVLRVGSVISVFIGGYLYIMNVRLPSVVRGVFFLFMLYPLIRMKFMESSQPSSVVEAGGYRKHIWVGMRELLNRRMIAAVLLITFVQGVTVSMFIGGLLRPLMLERTSLPVVDHSNFLTVVFLIAIAVLLYNGRKTKKKPKTLYQRALLYSLVILAGFLLNIPYHSLVGGLLGIIIIHIGSYLLVPTTSTIINLAASSKHRATALSTANLLEDIPYILAAPFIGLATDQGNLGMVIIIIATLIAVVIMAAWRLSSQVSGEAVS